MGKVLILEKDVKTIEMLELLLQALHQTYRVAYTHSNAIRIYTTERIDAIFMNPELPMIDPKALMDEIEVISTEMKWSRAPVVFLYTSDELVRRYELHRISDSHLAAKPIMMDRGYEILDGLGLTKLKMSANSRHLKDKIARFRDFVEQSETWMERFRDRLVKL